MKKTKILYITASADMGGAENFIYALLKSIDDERFEKYVVCPGEGYFSHKYKALATGTLFIDPKRSFMNVMTIFRVARFIERNEIDIIHTMLYTSDFCAIFARMVSSRKPRILNTINGFNFLIMKRGRLNIKRRLASLAYRFIYRFSDYLVAVAEAVRQDLIHRRGMKVRPGRIGTILAAGIDRNYDDFDENELNDLRNRLLKKDEVAVSAIGTFNEFKDYDNMVDAFSLVQLRNPKIKMFIAGDGPDRRRIMEKCARMRLNGRINFLGIMERRDKNKLLNMTDIFVMSSKSEGCPTVLFEAMYFAKPVVATNVGGIPEVVKDTETGFLVPAKSPRSLADAILNLAADSEKRLQFGLKARQVFEENFTQKCMLDSYEKAYEGLTRKKYESR